MNYNNDEEAISFFNRLLGSLHQADYSFKGSIQLVYVAKGAQHVGNIRTQNVYTNKRQESMPPPPDSPPILTQHPRGHGALGEGTAGRIRGCQLPAEDISYQVCLVGL